MIALKIQVIVAVTIINLNLSIVECWFERSNYRVDLESNTVFPLRSLPYQAGTSTRVAFVGQRGDRLSLVCNINFSRGCGRRNSASRRRRCCDDFFYVGLNLNPNIRGAERWCGRQTIRKNSRPTTGRPVLVIGIVNSFFILLNLEGFFINFILFFFLHFPKQHPRLDGDDMEDISVIFHR